MSNQFNVLKNSTSIFFAWLTPIAVQFLAIPFIVNRLGNDQYGIYTLGLTVMGYFAILDMNMVKGGIRYIAEFNGKGDDEKVKQVISFGFLAYLAIGILGCSLIMLSVDPVLMRMFKIPANYTETARIVLFLTGGGFLSNILKSYMLSLPKALHRFDISNQTDVLFQVITTLATVVLVYAGYGLLEIVALRIVSNLLCVIALMASVKRCLPYFRFTMAFEKALIRNIASYSVITFIGRIGTVTSNHFHLIVVGAILGPAAVTLFSVPQQLVSRIMSLSSRLSMMIFPISSELGAKREIEKLHVIYIRMSRFMFFLNMMLTVVFVAFAHDILLIWMGSEFADQAFRVLALIAVGFLFDRVTMMPSLVTEGLDHPMVTSAFAFIRGATAIALTYAGGVLVGLDGVAWGFLASSAICSISFNVYVHRITIKLSIARVLKEAYSLTFFCSLFITAITLVLKKAMALVDSFWISLASQSLIVSVLFMLLGYFGVLNQEERWRLMNTMMKKIPSSKSVHS
ncbi:hypothetical protein DSCA_23310 [Desulfosarcina alkanivorans]|uniref:Polysaccharide biosynthesis protein C-terminal domain-containing protein n=2 Tax=Desulfosarcina alkanivorans TaxID=571177 RepID=A0A5K7YNC3_9BACT|nr:oligosaccharide flippase family protein [Desulfosarcina alkanivorans]BBO68401.1 hypothetical protein DSCA_23310 [Desulfosarcina alkanivorans]